MSRLRILKAIAHGSGCIAGAAFAVYLWAGILLDGGSTARPDVTHIHFHEGAKGGYGYTTDRQDQARRITTYILGPAGVMTALFWGLYFSQKAREERRMMQDALSDTSDLS